MAYLSQHCCFFGDDYAFGNYSGDDEKIFDCLLIGEGIERYHGRGFLGLFFCKFLSFGLPNILGIHPSDFTGIPHGFSKGIFTVITLILLTKFSTFYIKNKFLFFSVLFWISCYFFSNALRSNVINVNYNFYRYFFSLIFFSYFWYYIYKNIILKTTKINVFKLLTACFCGYFIGNSIEINIFVSCLMSVLLIFYNFFIKILAIYKKIYKRHCYNLNISFYLPIIFLFTSTLIFTGSYGWQNVAFNERQTFHSVINYDLLKEFCIKYYEIYIKANWGFWSLFIVITLFALIYILLYKRKHLKNILFPFLMMFSILAVIFSLICCGKTCDLTETGDIDFYLFQKNIIFLFKILICIPLFITFSLFLKIIKNYIKYQKLKLDWNTILKNTCICVIITGTFLYEDIFNIITKSELLKSWHEQKQELYMTDKIFLWYYLKGEKPIIPSDSIYCQYNDYSHLLLLYSYYKKTYLLKESIDKFAFKCDKDGLEKFYEAGGTFEQDELENIKFSRLFNNDFVLNKSK